MDNPNGPQAKKSHPLARALVDIVDIALSDGEASTSDSDRPRLTAKDVADHGAKKWAKFARKQGLPFRKDLPVAEILADQRLSAFFEEMRQRDFPVHGAGALLEAEWQGVPFVSYAAYSVFEGGSILPYRFVCTPLSRVYPGLIRDERLQVYPDHRRDLHPNIDDYELVDGPTPPPKRSKREPGLLGRTPIGREVREKVDDFFAPRPRKLHAVSKDYAAQIASRPYEPEAFKRDWAVKGRWLVMYEEEYIRPLGAPDKTHEFLNALPVIKRLVD